MTGEGLREYVVTLTAHASTEVRVLAVDAEQAGEKALKIAELDLHPQIDIEAWRVDETRPAPPRARPAAEAVACVSTFDGEHDGPVDRVVVYRSSKGAEIDRSGLLCRAHAGYEYQRAAGAGGMATAHVEPSEPEVTVHVDDLAGYARMRAKAIRNGDTF